MAQRYLGWYDSNPAHLAPLAPVESARRHVEFMGGADAVLQKARTSYEAGDYRWVVQVLHHVIFADPGNAAAHALAAAAFDQLGYQAEAGTWRNESLMAAYELRNGVPKEQAIQVDSADTLRAMTVPMFLDSLGVRLNGPKAAGKRMAMNLVLSDVKERYAITLENGCLVYTPDKRLKKADLTLTLTRSAFDDLFLGEAALEDSVRSGAVKVQGDGGRLAELMGLLDTFDPKFPIVTP